MSFALWFVATGLPLAFVAQVPLADARTHAGDSLTVPRVVARDLPAVVSLTTKCAAAVTAGPAAPFRQSAKVGAGNARSAIDECVAVQNEHELASETTAARSSLSPTVQLDGPRSAS